MPDIRESDVPALDVKGFFLSGIGLSLTVFGLTVVGRGLVSGPVVAVMVLVGLLFIAAYVVHARTTAHPILDLRLFSNQSYRASVFGGSLYRVAVGAVPFLLPLLLQLGFGFTAFQSGLVTAAAAVGAMAMKFTVARLIRRFGFREMLLINGALSCLLMAANGFLTPLTPFWIMAGLTLAGGYLRSLQFSALNALGYSDIENVDMSRATSLFTTVQQLSLASGVATAAFALDGSRWLAGRHDLALGDFTFAFGLVSVIALFSLWQYWRLPDNAGAAVSGRRAEG
jgi:hypothetical protein